MPDIQTSGRCGQMAESELEWRLLVRKAERWLVQSAPARPDGRPWLEIATALLPGLLAEGQRP